MMHLLTDLEALKKLMGIADRMENTNVPSDKELCESFEFVESKLNDDTTVGKGQYALLYKLLATMIIDRITSIDYPIRDFISQTLN